MAVYKRNIIDIDLEQGNIHRSFLNNSIGMKDQKADHFGVRVFRNGEPVSLTGVSVQGVFMPPQGSPIAITSGNIVSGNVAEVVLPQACYNYDGQFTLAIKLVDSSNGVTDTVRIVDGVVDNTHATGTVAPTSAVPTYQEVLSVYEQAIAVIGKSVRFDTEQSLTDTQKTTARGNIDAASTGDVSELKSALTSIRKRIVSSSDFTETGYIKTDGTIKSDASSWKCTDYIEVDQFDYILEFIGYAEEATSPLPTIALYDTNHVFLSALHGDFDGYDFTLFAKTNGIKYIRMVTSALKASSSYLDQCVSFGSLSDNFANKESMIYEVKASNYSDYTFGNAISSSWYGVGSTVIKPSGADAIHAVIKAGATGTFLIECVDTTKNITLFNGNVSLAQGINRFYIDISEADTNDEIYCRVSSTTAGQLFQISSETTTAYAVTNKCYAKNSSKWNTTDVLNFSIPIDFYSFVDKYYLEGESVSYINAHSTIPSIYTVQFSDNKDFSPPFAVFVDSVIKSKQRVLFDGMDRFYLKTGNATQANDIATSQETAVLSGDGFADKSYTFNNICVKTQGLSSKSAVVLQIGDSVTNGSGSMYNTDSKPDRSWAYMAWLGKKYLQNYEAVGYNASETITLANGTTYVAKAEGIGGWALSDYLYETEKTVSGITNQNLFYDANKTWQTAALNTAGVKFSLAKYIQNTGITTPTHVVIQLGFNDTTNFIQNMGYIIAAIHEEYPSIIIGLSLLRDFGMFFNQDYPLIVPNSSAFHGGLYNKTQGWIESYMALEDQANNVYYIPTFFVSPTGDSIPTYSIDDKEVAFRADSGYHPNHKAHVEWGKEMFAWLAYTLLK